MSTFHETVSVPLGKVVLPGDLDMPENAASIVIFSHGSGSSRLSPRNKLVARHLRNIGLATFLFDLLTPEEEPMDFRFDISLLTERLVGTTEWLLSQTFTRDLAPGYFGASTGAASALNAAAFFGDRIHAVVSRGGRPDMAMEALPNVKAATLLLVGSLDKDVLELNQAALKELPEPKELIVVQDASHLFEEPGKLEEVSSHAGLWFGRYLHHAVAEGKM